MRRLAFGVVELAVANARARAHALHVAGPDDSARRSGLAGAHAVVVCGLAQLLGWAFLERDLAGVLWRRWVERLGRSGAAWALYALLSLIAIAACVSVRSPRWP